MISLMLLTALAAPGQSPACGDGWYGWYGYGGSYAHGYGLFRPAPSDAGGLVLPPAWPCDPTPWAAGKVWFDFVMQLDGYERDDMIRVWEKATPGARKRLLEKLPCLAYEAAVYRDQVERERAMERYKIENRPLTEEEIALFEAYYLKLKGLARKEARDRWRGSDNRGRRLYLKEVLRDQEAKELEKEDQKDYEDEKEIQKELQKEKAKKEKEDKARKEKEEKEKKDKEKKEKDKKDKEDKDKKDKEDKEDK
jgi:hypothetical protein